MLNSSFVVRSYGDAVDSYISEFSPLEWTLSEHRQDHRAFVKVVVNTQANNRVLGLHILSPNAGEIIQGFACAFRKNLTYQDLMDTVGIHPTVAEEFTLVTASKSSGASATKTSC
jgi:thioredoxin reductase (NADPH)